jgi:hypothetical protein
MVIIPALFNALQFWITDNIIKKKPTQTPEEDPEHEKIETNKSRNYNSINESKIIVVESK